MTDNTLADLQRAIDALNRQVEERQQHRAPPRAEAPRDDAGRFASEPPSMSSAIRRLVESDSAESPAAIAASKRLAAGGEPPRGVDGRALSAALKKLAEPMTSYAEVRARQAGFHRSTYPADYIPPLSTPRR